MPTTAHGQRLAVSIASCLASSLSDQEMFPFRPLGVAAHRWLYFLVHALAWETSYMRRPGRRTMARQDTKAAIVGMMFRSTPHLVRCTWNQHAALKARRPSRIAGVFSTALSFSPLALLVFTVWQWTLHGHYPWEMPRYAVLAGAGLLIGDLLGWSKIIFDPRPSTGLRTPLDIIISTLLGPAFVLRELRDDVRYKRRDDRFIKIWTAVIIALMTIVILYSANIACSALSILVCLDTLIQANARLGAITLLSRQCDVMTQYLVSGGRSDAY